MIVRKYATFMFKTECNKSGKLVVGSDFTSDETVTEIQTWLTFLAKSTVAKEHKVRFSTVEVSEFKLEGLS